MEDQKFLEDVLKVLVSHPQDVAVKRIVNEKGVLLTVDVHQEDLGGLIGKLGRNISAVRHLVRMIGLRNKAFVSVRLNQPEK